MDNDFLDVKDVAEILKLSERKIRELFNTGEIQSRKIAGKYITTRNILKNYIENDKELT